MKIEKLILHNFRGYDHTEIIFNDFNCIVGKNDVGKSTIFEALNWFFNKDYTYLESNFNYKSFKYDKETYSFYDEETDSFENSEEETNYLVDGDLMYVELCFSGFRGLEYAWNCYGEGECPYFIDNADFLDDKGLFCVKKELINTSSSQFVNYYQGETTPVYYLKCKCYGEDKEPISLIGNVCDYYSNIADRDDSLLKKHKELSKRRSCSNLVEIPKCEKLISKKIREYYSKCKCVYREVDIAKYRFYIADLFPKFYLFTPETFGVEANKIINYYFGNKIGNSLKIESLNGLIQDDLDAIANALNQSGLVGDVELIPSIYINWSEMVNVSLNFRDGKHKLPLLNRGDGVKRILLNTVFRMIAYKGYGHNLIFAFDEPETGLHPSAQTDFLESLKHLSSIYHQVFITTHSPTIVSQCKPDEIIHIRKDENGISKACQNDDTSLKEVVEDLGICSNNLLLSLFGTAKCLFLVEGPDDVLAFEYLCIKYKEMGKVENTFKEMGCAIIPSGGCDSIKHWSTFKVIEQIGKPFYIVLDSDKENSTMDSPNYKKLQEAYPNRTDCFQVLRKREIENYIPSSYFYSLMPSIAISYGDWDDVKEICKRHSDSIRLKGKKVCEGHFRYLTYEQLRSTFCPDGQDEHDEFLEIYEKIKSLCNG